MRNWSWRVITAFSLSAVGFVLITFFGLTSSFHNAKGVFDPLLASEFGSFIGGLVGPMFYLAGFFLLYETIIVQNKSFEKQQFETKFFELLRFHRQNVTEMEYRLPYEEHKYINGPLVFREIKSQFTKLYKIVSPFIEASPAIPADRKKIETIDITYLLLFFGVSQSTLPILEHILEKRYDRQLTTDIILEVRKERTAYNPDSMYFGGHQLRLAHYYRHLFQIVNYVDSTDFITDIQKYDYVKILRAQLSQHEVAIFFLNSLSIGQPWEKNGYITKYKFIKNLPPNFVDNVDPKEYYPGFEYEWEE
ncbi:MAG: hypothetical protein JWO03_4100 [Bacteroidetes bacterium]|nr:hypothetical protein [Bacteroidota bacterium]